MLGILIGFHHQGARLVGVADGLPQPALIERLAGMIRHEPDQ